MSTDAIRILRQNKPLPLPFMVSGREAVPKQTRATKCWLKFSEREDTVVVSITGFEVRTGNELRGEDKFESIITEDFV